jgi:hypothetical protein
MVAVVVAGFAVFYLLHCTNVYEERRYESCSLVGGSEE